MTQIIPATPGSIIISVEYDATGLARAAVSDHRLLAWHVDPIGSTMPPWPSIIGSIPLIAPTPDTAPIISPQWGVFENPAVIVQDDLWRGTASDFFSWLATNNGAARPLEKRFAISSALYNAFDDWAEANPHLVFEPVVSHQTKSPAQ